jgi:hypothetical protein
MNTHDHDVDPKYGLPLWWEVVHHFRKYPPLVQVHQYLETPQATPDKATQAAHPPRWLGWLAVAGLAGLLMFVAVHGVPGHSQPMQHYGQY